MNKVTLSTIVFVLGLSVAWVYLNRGNGSLLLYLVDLPIFILLYGLLFSIAIPEVSQGIRYGTRKSRAATVGFPLILIAVLYLYLVVHDQAGMDAAMWLIPYYLLFPVLVYSPRLANFQEISWFDIIVVLAFLIPVTILEFSGRSHLPVEGVHFDSVFRMIILLVAVYAFVVIRRLRDVGFWIDLTGRKIWTTVWVWAVYIGLVIVTGLAMGFVRFGEAGSTGEVGFDRMLARFLTIFLHTALFEELFFRGFLQNMITKLIRRSSTPLIFWLVSTVLLVGLSLVTGVGMGGELFWFPFLISILVFGGAYLLSTLFIGYRHYYLGLAIVSVLFGLVHFHAGSVVYVGLAMLAGWAYGYVYWKTKSVLYSALIHTLVNFTPLILVNMNLQF